MEQPDMLFDDPLQMTWQRPAKKGGCGRDPSLGPGSCKFWWEGCPRAEERGCYLVWEKAQRDAGNIPDGPGKARRP